jgi:hypothetical protein
MTPEVFRNLARARSEAVENAQFGAINRVGEKLSPPGTGRPGSPS